MGLTEDPITSRFQHHVSFDNFAGGEPTVKNSISFTLNVKHRGYQPKRRSRTFMVGVDENDYSDIALSWMLEELVDDGDEIICLRVVDKDAKVVNDRNVDKKQYQEEAKKLMERIQSRNDDNRAISIVLEFAVGKVHNVFQKMASYAGKLLGEVRNCQFELLLILFLVDPTLRTRNAHRWHTRAEPGRIPRLDDHVELLFEMVSAVLTYTSCRGTAHREADKEEEETRCRPVATRLCQDIERERFRDT